MVVTVIVHKWFFTYWWNWTGSGCGLVILVGPARSQTSPSIALQSPLLQEPGTQTFYLHYYLFQDLRPNSDLILVGLKLTELMATELILAELMLT